MHDENDNLIAVPIRFDAVKSRGRVYYFEWTRNGGCVPFGMHGTINEWEVKKVQMLSEMKEGEYITLNEMRKV